MAKTWKRPVAALLLCALLAGAGSLAAAPYAGESGELTPQERALLDKTVQSVLARCHG